MPARPAMTPQDNGDNRALALFAYVMADAWVEGKKEEAKAASDQFKDQAANEAHERERARAHELKLLEAKQAHELKVIELRASYELAKLEHSEAAHLERTREDAIERSLVVIHEKLASDDQILARKIATLRRSMMLEHKAIDIAGLHGA